MATGVSAVCIRYETHGRCPASSSAGLAVPERGARAQPPGRPRGNRDTSSRRWRAFATTFAIASAAAEPNGGDFEFLRGRGLGSQNANRDRQGNSHHTRPSQRGLLPKSQIRKDSVGHNALNSFLQIRAGNACHARQRRFDVQLADVENRVRIIPRIAAEPQHLFIAGPLAFFDESPTDPPDQRMKPERRLDQHVNRRRKVVPPTHMAQFMRQHRIELSRRQLPGNPLRKQ